MFRSRNSPIAPAAAPSRGLSLGEREVAHRVGTSLQTMASIVRRYQRQLTQIPNPDAAHEALGVVERSLMATAMVQHLLDPGACRTGGFATLLDKLGVHLRTIYERPTVRITVTQSAEPACGQAHIAAIVATELIANALRHGFGPNSRGDIAITLQGLPFNGTRLMIRDDGTGMPDDLVADDPRHGLGLAFELVRDAGGTMELLSYPVETAWRIDLPAGANGVD